MEDASKPGRRPRAAPIAERLAKLIGQQIADGVYRPGDKLPSLRELSQLHRYAKNTVVVAFEMLVAQGLVEPRRGAGFFVLDAKPRDGHRVADARATQDAARRSAGRRRLSARGVAGRHAHGPLSPEGGAHRPGRLVPLWQPLRLRAAARKPGAQTGRRRRERGAPATGTDARRERGHGSGDPLLRATGRDGAGGQPGVLPPVRQAEAGGRAHAGRAAPVRWARRGGAGSLVAARKAQAVLHAVAGAQPYWFRYFAGQGL
ncbi:hypothetical protein G6F31_015543 [Rhizopus arrhizus]|nr:hypothetical protein G6F31_015543 [Rhizopus arrhizus]